VGGKRRARALGAPLVQVRRRGNSERVVTRQCGRVQCGLVPILTQLDDDAPFALAGAIAWNALTGGAIEDVVIQRPPDSIA
jgi:hypothetical protein